MLPPQRVEPSTVDGLLRQSSTATRCDAPPRVRTRSDLQRLNLGIRCWIQSYNLLGGHASGEFNLRVRPLVAILLYLVAVLLGGALLAPWVWHLAQWSASHSAAFQSLASAPFHRFVSRCFLVVAVLGLWPFLRIIGVRSIAAAGLSASVGRFGAIGRGFAMGFTSLGIAAVIALVADARRLHVDFTAVQWISHLLNASLAAAAVGLFEELFFRGAIFGALRRAHSLGVAVAVSSGLYAMLHFFKRVEWTGQVDWLSGLALLPRMMRGFGAVDELFPTVLALFLAGAILALAVERTGSLWLAIGLHAGWIWWLKGYALITVPVETAATAVWGTGRLVDGWIAPLLLVVPLVWVWRMPPRREGSEVLSSPSS